MKSIKNNLDFYRKQIDLADKEIIFYLAKRFEFVKKIGEYKKENNIGILQKNRWEKVLNNAKNIGKKNNLNEKFIENIWNLIHKEALNIEKK